MSATPPGWYDDGHGSVRWWDGSQWTDAVREPEAVGAEVSPAAATDPAAAPAASPGAPADAAAPSYAGYPGEPAPEPAAPAKSRLWILWVVLGGVVLLFVILAIVLVPIVTGVLARGVTASGADEAAAVEVVEQYDDAWGDADCDAYEAATTETYRAAIGLTDCASFEQQAAAFGDSTDEYDLIVTGIQTVADDRIEVVTVESYLSLVDDQGTPLDTPVPVEDHFRYVLVDTGDGWAIDDLTTEP